MTAPPAPRPARSFRTVAVVIALCWLAVFFDGMDVNIYGAVMPHLLDDTGLGFTPALAGTVGSWTTFGMLLGALAAGTLTDSWGRKPLVMASITLFSLGSALCALAPGVTVFGAGRFVSGLGLGGLMPIGLAIVAEFAPPRRAALATGVMMTSYHAGGMTATGIGLTVAPEHGWRWVFWAGVLPALVAVPLVAAGLPESPGVLLARGRTQAAHAVAARYRLPAPEEGAAPQAGAKGRLSAVTRLFHPRSRWATPLLWIASFAGLLLVYGVSTWLPELMRASGYSLSSSVTFLMLINAGGILGMLVAGRTADRFGPVKVSAIWFLLTACGTFLLRAHLPLAAAYTIVFITGIWLFSAQVMVYAATARTYAPAERATGLGWVTGIGRTGAVVGPTLGGAVVAGGNAALGFTTFAVAAVLGAVAISLVPLTRTRRGLRATTPTLATADS
ncbi:benzoate transporter [Streptomyces cellostaticus]|uniref:Benzoate transporter n=1 Tax=Streptomyces cellostaticus TaxID=67285 RepID=A0A101NTM1_9ACTN|nr:aromatic acid/H+ symport family MFS transporter [Streptomyces cellostaticus]KUM99046.1 benzoate transporter [Streptomyces cellostaticus]GHI03485.1 MFS transporter [Streptomyces cellostaticus]